MLQLISYKYIIICRHINVNVKTGLIIPAETEIMDNRIKELLESVINGRHHMHRRNLETRLAEDFSRNSVPHEMRAALRLKEVLEAEAPIIGKDERIVMLRTIKKLPELYTGQEWEEIKSSRFIHELGNVSNISPDYSSVIKSGLDKKAKEIATRMEQCKKSGDMEGERCLAAMAVATNAVTDFAERYRKAAAEAGNSVMAAMLGRVPRKGARTFHEALQFFRIIHFALWCEGDYHNTVGRFDQYMFPYLKKDIQSGQLDRDSAMELLLEFFISFNKDSDLYPGVQQGDNGQSMMLGGVGIDGREAFNMLSEMCLIASRELKLIDPKINLRVSNKTGRDIYKLGTELTEVGLGFPQYSNDDIVIPGLTELGYDLEDARDYTVAACWEFIIPGYGMDIPNIGALSFPAVVDRCLHGNLPGSKDFNAFMGEIRRGITAECMKTASGIKRLWMIPAPFMSIMMRGCIESARDISMGAKYNNFGFHGTGLSTAVDSLAAIKKYVFDDKAVAPENLIKAIDSDFDSNDELLAILRNEAPKFGNGEGDTDVIASDLLEAFSDALKGLKNERGGIFRAGTGSAMYYLWHAAEVGASADGRRKGEAFGANYSPSLFAKLKGPISVIRSFTKPALKKVINGGPLTMEFHSSIFSDNESRGKVAELVKYFIDSGGHQLQLNAVNRDVLIEAQKNPGKYRQLIVRIWGWSAYFTELDKEYQDHVIKRQEYI